MGLRPLSILLQEGLQEKETSNSLPGWLTLIEFTVIACENPLVVLALQGCHLHTQDALILQQGRGGIAGRV